MRLLNNLKNKRIFKYDYAYRCMVTNTSIQDSDLFVQEIRTAFFNFLKPFLIEVPSFINNMKGKKDSEKVFSKYFD